MSKRVPVGLCGLENISIFAPINLCFKMSKSIYPFTSRTVYTFKPNYLAIEKKGGYSGSSKTITSPGVVCNCNMPPIETKTPLVGKISFFSINKECLCS